MPASEMVTEFQVLAEEYVAALRDYVDGGGEAALDQGRKLGLSVLDRGAGVADLALVASHAVGILLLAAESPEESVAIVRAASEFFTEALSPLELTQEGFREALETLGRLNAVLENDVSAHLRSLREAESRLDRVLALVADAVLVVGGDHCVTAASRGAAAMLGSAAGELVGRPLADLIPGIVDDNPPAAAAQAGAAPGRDDVDGQPRRVWARRLDGSELVVDAVLSRLRHFDRSEMIVVLSATAGGPR